MLDLKSAAARLWDWMTDDFSCAAALATLYPGRSLAALATRVGLSFPGHRVEKVPRAELLDAIRETMGAQLAERKRVLDEVVAALQVHQAAVSGLDPDAVERWLAIPDEVAGIRRLLAIVAFGAPKAVQVAERWWRASVKNAADDVAADAQADHEISVLTAAMEQAARPLGEAASILQEVFAQVRGLARSLEQEEARRTQLLTKQAADLTKGHDAILRELARLQSWAGEQQASLRTAVGELTGALRVLEARMERFEGGVRDLVGRIGAVGVALERGQVAITRRQLTRLRAGTRRVGIFVDAVNLSVSAREAHDCGVRYGALRERGGELGEVVLARAYVTEHPVPEKQAALETALRRSGFEVRTLPLRQLSDGKLKANWDLGLATDLMRSKEDLDVIVLGTGDGDFVELVRWLREEGLQVHVAAVSGHTAGELIAAADGWIPLGDGALVQTGAGGRHLSGR